MKTNTVWLGKHSKMHDSNIPKVKGYFGSNTCVLETGTVQIMFFDSRLGNIGPFYMSATERNTNKKERLVEFST